MAQMNNRIHRLKKEISENEMRDIFNNMGLSEADLKAEEFLFKVRRNRY